MLQAAGSFDKQGAELYISIYGMCFITLNMQTKQILKQSSFSLLLLVPNREILGQKGNFRKGERF